MTYTVLNLFFLAAVAVAVVLAHRRTRRDGAGTLRWTDIAWTGAAVLVLTAIFDNVIIAAGIVGYAPQHLLGVTIWLAPIEDFAYTVAAVVGLPAVWVLLGRKQTTPTGSGTPPT